MSICMIPLHYNAGRKALVTIEPVPQQIATIFHGDIGEWLAGVAQAFEGQRLESVLIARALLDAPYDAGILEATKWLNAVADEMKTDTAGAEALRKSAKSLIDYARNVLGSRL